MSREKCNCDQALSLEKTMSEMQRQLEGFISSRNWPHTPDVDESVEELLLYLLRLCAAHEDKNKDG